MRKPAAGEVIYGRRTAVPVSKYENELIRASIEEVMRQQLTAVTGLTPEDERWEHIPESTHTDEATGDPVTLPELWMFSVEAVGPIDLAVQ